MIRVVADVSGPTAYLTRPGAGGESNLQKKKRSWEIKWWKGSPGRPFKNCPRVVYSVPRHWRMGVEGLTSPTPSQVLLPDLAPSCSES